jgi:hypothetical protein
MNSRHATTLYGERPAMTHEERHGLFGINLSSERTAVI